MKILHVAETIKGGVGTVIDELVEYQSNKDSNSSIMCLVPKQHFNDLFKSKSKNNKIFTFDRKRRGIKSLWNLYVQMKNIVNNESPDIIHLHSTFAGFVGRVFIFMFHGKSKIRIVYSPHAFAFLMKSSLIKKKAYTIIEKALSLFTDKIICVSEYEFNEAVKVGINPKKLVVVHNGVTPTKPEQFKAINIENHINFLYVGRFDYQKGIDILLKAISLLDKEEKRKFTFNLVGDVVNEESDAKLFSSEIESCIVRHGWLDKDKIFEQYRLADCIILPSRWEGFAMVPLEAMAHGTPVMLSDIPPFKELAKGINDGIIFKSNDPTSLLNAIRSLNSKDLTSYRNNAFEMLLNNYTERSMNIKTMSVYETIL